MPARAMKDGLRACAACACAAIVFGPGAGALAQPATGDDSLRLLTIDHYVTQVSAVPSIKGQLTELYIREIRGVERVHLIGWSLGGPRAGGYAANHPEKVGRLVPLAPAYDRNRPAGPPETPGDRPAMSSQSYENFLSYWNGRAKCADQRDPVAGEIIFSEMLESDPVGATWGPGIRRAPGTAVWGWNEDAVRRSQIPLLAISGAQDASVAPARELYEDYGADEKVLIDVDCATHGAMWESVHGRLFAASLEWLRSGTVEGETSGIVRMGY